MLEWNHPQGFIIFKFEVESINAQGELLTDKAIKQSREVRYILSNSNKVNAQFNPDENGTGEYDFFLSFLGTTLFLEAISLLETKLNERGIFD